MTKPFTLKRRHPLYYRLRDLFSVIRRAWWIARGERQRIMDENARLKAWAAQSAEWARAADQAVHELRFDHRGASIDVLRNLADEIDCDPGCDIVSPMDMSTGMTECRLSDRGECPFDKACQLRDLAKALETYAAISTPREPAA